jgi:hypothetical protein
MSVVTLAHALSRLGEWEFTTVMSVADLTVVFGHTADQGKVVVYAERYVGFHVVDATPAQIKAAQVCFAFEKFATEEDLELAEELQPESKISPFRFIP